MPLLRFFLNRPIADVRGVTLVELAVVLAAASLLLAAAVSYSVPRLQQERTRSAVYDLQTMMRLARTEAVKRNHPCRLVVNPGARTLQVWDGNGTTTLSDDDLLHSRRLPQSVAFASPDGSAAVTLQSIDGTSSFQTVFRSNGTISAGAGRVRLHGGDRFEEVLVVDSGSTQVQHWNGSTWTCGN